MSIGKSLWVSCDGDPDGAMCDAEVVLQGRQATVAQVRAEARAQGWTRKGDADLCPEHSPRETSTT